ncbi:hypothetical protein UFOVP41_54 [uncultured Caudovirales phage]|uniref:Uncharacterized protein n=1 Tax=uncultured Caudovirales phage TaxID=2100421 RepID=A0A6J5KMA3_9CAUD|nr:hypothetical protein UFOVP41_54 [uncultured Caudovirales phage]
MYKWSILELFATNDELSSVRYLLTLTEDNLTVASEGNHTFLPGTVNKQLADIVESDIVQWLEKDTTNDGVNAIKLAVKNQLKNLQVTKKVDFPWETGTFTIE